MRLDRKPRNWEDRLTLFVGFLVEERKQSTTIKSYISAIKAVLLDNNIHLCPDQYLLKSLTRGCKLENDRVRHRLPIQRGLLSMLLGRVDICLGKQAFLALLYKTLLSTAYFGLFRVGELTHTLSDHAVLAQDVHIACNKKKMMLVLRTSKTHGKNTRPQKIKISSCDKIGRSPKRTDSFTFCPFKLLLDYATIRGGYVLESEQFFIFRDCTAVKVEHFRRFLRSLLHQLGFDSTLYGTHSLRAGRSIDLLKVACQSKLLKIWGHWKSNAVFNYLNN